jgi:hypothetical protein
MQQCGAFLTTIVTMEKQHCAAMRTQQSVYFVTERFYVAVNNTNVLRSSCKVTDCFSDFNKIWISQTDFNKSIPHKYHKIPSTGCRADVCGGTDGYDDAKRPYTKAPKILYERFPPEFPYGAFSEKKSAGYGVSPEIITAK